MQGKVAILGNADFVMPYSAMGLDCFTADTTAEIGQSAEKIIAENYAVIIVAENIAPAIEEVLAQFAAKPVPCAVVVPFTAESKGLAAESLSRLLKTATGINILK